MTTGIMRAHGAAHTCELVDSSQPASAPFTEAQGGRAPAGIGPRAPEPAGLAAPVHGTGSQLGPALPLPPPRLPPGVWAGA